MLVSVIIPTYQRRELVQKAVSSALSQTHGDIEVIVVDDGSTDGTKEEFDRLPLVRLVSRGHFGASAARNAGAKEARGEFLAFLDSDDEWEEDKIEHQIRAMQKEGVEISLSGAEVEWDGKDLTASNIGGWLSKRDIFRIRRPISASALMIRKDLFDRISFDEGLLSANDLDFLLRARGVSRILSLEKPSVRIHKSLRRPRLSTDFKRKAVSYMRLLKKALDGVYGLGAAEGVEFAVRLLVLICAFSAASLVLRKGDDRHLI